jgi:hypothetical protein
VGETVINLNNAGDALKEAKNYTTSSDEGMFGTNKVIISLLVFLAILVLLAISK